MSSVHKSYHEHNDPIIAYTSAHTVQQNALQKELQAKTLAEAPLSIMLGAPEVLTIGQHFIQLINAKKILDVGTYTGASALAWALATEDDGKIYTLDINHDNYRKFGVPILQKCEKSFKKIQPVEGPALEYLDKLIADGQAGTFDFAFIDADKANYSNYYDRIVQLLRKGGIVIVDNSLWNGFVAQYDPATAEPATIHIDKCNKVIFADSRTNSFLVNTGDGLHVAFKK